MNTIKLIKVNKFNATFILLFSIFSLTMPCLAQNKTRKEKNSYRETNKKNNEMKTIHLTKIDFLKKVANYEANPNEWKYLGDKPALIDFYADWCGPCKVIAPTLEELAAEYDGDIYIYKINTEEEQELAALFGIRSIPSLLFIPLNGQPQMAQGAVPKYELKKAIDEILIKKEADNTP